MIYKEWRGDTLYIFHNSKVIFRTRKCNSGWSRHMIYNSNNFIQMNIDKTEPKFYWTPKIIDGTFWIDKNE